MRHILHYFSVLCLVAQVSAGSPEAPVPDKMTVVVDRVIARLAASASLRGSDVRVSAENGAIVLEGEVPTRTSAIGAERLARRVQGVERILNRLSVEPRRVKTADIHVSNSELGRAVAEAIAEKVFGGRAKVSKDAIYGWQVAGDNFSFDIEVDDGSVTLDGEAPSPAKVREAIRHARLVPGVRSVHSMLYLESYGHGKFSLAKGYPDVPYYYWPY